MCRSNFVFEVALPREIICFIKTSKSQSVVIIYTKTFDNPSTYLIKNHVDSMALFIDLKIIIISGYKSASVPKRRDFRVVVVPEDNDPFKTQNQTSYRAFDALASKKALTLTTSSFFPAKNA